MASQIYTDEKIYHLRMKMECIIKMHILVDNILLKFDQNGIPPKVDDIKNYESQNPTKANLNADLKLTLDAIKKEILSLEESGCNIQDIKTGKVSWNKEELIYSWSYYNNELKEIETA